MKCKSLIPALITASLGFTCMAQADPGHTMRLEAQGITNSSSPQVKHEITSDTFGMPPIDKSAEDRSTSGNQKLAETKGPNDIHPDPVRLIVIDPGHGGTNEGAIGTAQIHEKHLTLQVALLLADRLRAEMPDVQIVLTRQRDQSLSLMERIDIANQMHADLFLSLHFNNSNNPEAIGFESFWAGQFWEADMVRDGIEITDDIRAQRERAGTLSERMATCFNRAMRHRFDVLDRGVKTGDYTVLTRSEVPAVVLEMAFLSHAQEGISIISAAHRAKLVDALVDAVTHYAK